MVQRTPHGLPYVEPTDTLVAYPVTSKELAETLESLESRLRVETAAWSLTTNGTFDAALAVVAGSVTLPARPYARRLTIRTNLRVYANTAVMCGTCNVRLNGSIAAQWFPFIPVTPSGGSRPTQYHETEVALAADAACVVDLQIQSGSTGLVGTLVASGSSVQLAATII